MEKPGRVQSMGSQKVGYDWATSLSLSLVAQMLKCLLTVRDKQARSLGWEDPLEKAMAPHCSTLAWKIPWVEEPGRLQSLALQRVGHDWVTSLSLFFHFHFSFTFTFTFLSLSLFFHFRFVIAFLLSSKSFLISWLQSPSAVILEPKKIKSVTVSTVSPSICHEVMRPEAMIFVFWTLSFKSIFSLSSCSLVALCFLPYWWYHLHIWGYWYFSH